MRNKVEGGIFVYALHPEDLKNGIAPGYFACVLFTTGWEGVRVQATKIMSAKQQRKAKEME